jgi:hypothetical protein
MISAARVWMLAAAAGAMLLFAGAPAGPATAQGPAAPPAQGDACKADVVTASGRGKFRPFTKAKELAGKGSAMADAVAAWQREVAATHGERWKLWSEAKDKSFDCTLTQGKILRGLVACTIHGRPCAIAEAPAAPAVVGGNDNKGRRADRDDDDRVGHVGGRSWRYRHEMRRQEALAQYRKRREDWGWRREDARQHYLERLRDRHEEVGWERTDARERWLARDRD